MHVTSLANLWYRRYDYQNYYALYGFVEAVLRGISLLGHGGAFAPVKRGCHMDVAIQMDLTARPVSCYAELWGRDAGTLNSWCRKDWVPGAYKHPSGEWWVNPIALLGFDPSDVESVEEESQGRRFSREDKSRSSRRSDEGWAISMRSRKGKAKRQ